MKWKNLNTFENSLEELKNLSAYEILQVSENADIDTIKKAYKKLVSQNHPDKKSDFFKTLSDEKMKIINRAYESLLNNE